MKWLNYYKQNGLESEDDVFNYLLNTFRQGVADWEYFVNWDKVFSNTRQVEVILNTLNYLLGKDNFEAEFKYLATRHPEIIKAIPVLIVRDGSKSQKYNVATVNGTELVEEKFDFSITNPSTQDIDAAVSFIKNSGLIRVFQKDGVKNLVDYVFGVEAGLSSNGRKNRGGTAMENVSEALLKNLGLNYIPQASPKEIKKQFGIDLDGNDGRIFDFAVLADNGLTIIEVNCYSSGGSKLDKTASDYRGLQDDLRGKATFIWLTDGGGWQKTKNPLRKTFGHNDYVLNIQMIKEGSLTEILKA
jgi:type II restriction enzyme